jgi:hypothetical protein
MSEVQFKDDPPYDLPPAQSAEAQALDETVELTFHALVSGRLPSPAPIRIQMTPTVARALAGQMQAAATAAEMRARKNQR